MKTVGIHKSEYTQNGWGFKVSISLLPTLAHCYTDEEKDKFRGNMPTFFLT